MRIGKSAPWIATALAIAVGVGTASAADLAVKAPPALPAAPAYNWSGFYAGLNVGGSWGNANDTFNTNVPAVPALSQTVAADVARVDGAIGGGQLGYNLQAGGFVFGLESDVQGLAVGVSEANWFAASPRTYVQGVRSQHNLGTVRGRAGFLVTPTLLTYATAGLAYGEADLSAAWFSPSLAPKLNGGGTAYGYQDMRTGWTGGGGVEWMFLPKWSAKIEYLYYDLGTVTTLPLQAVYASKGLFSNASYQGRFNGDVIRAGVDYHFGWGALPPLADKF